MLHAILAWAVVHELADRNVAAGVPHPRKRNREGAVLRLEDVQGLARSFSDDQDRVAFLTFFVTGIRCAELQSTSADFSGVT